MGSVGELPRRCENRIMPHALRPMEEGDLWQASEIERDAFPTLFPPTAFQRELKNRLAWYLVAWQRYDLATPDDDPHAPNAPPPPTVAAPNAPGSPQSPRLGRIISGARSLLGRRRTIWQPGQQYLTGFIGAWHMVDEAHIVAVGVRGDLRGQGIGELLLIGAIENARARGMLSATLEVRTSNYIAQRLYAKYGFRNMGVRKAYYSDNHEDALIMTAPDISAPRYSDTLAALVNAHADRWGASQRVIG